MPASFPNLSPQERALERIGTTIQGKYQIHRLLGIGGMATVYAATHHNGHKVAIKFLLEHLLHDSDIYRLFSREAYVANKVDHPGAVPVLDNDIDDGGCPFLIMPLLEGETLRTRWERANKRLPLAEVCVLMLDVLDVLAAAHAKGIVHRDLKPENLFLTTKGEVRVLDFGIARRSDGDGSTTVAGRMIGTPAFMPPEQALGERDAISPQSDIWAVGATIFTLLSGEFVHRTDSANAQLAAAATRRARSLADISSELPIDVLQVVDKALAFEPAERWASATEMHDAVARVAEEALGERLATGAARIRAGFGADLSSRLLKEDAKETERPLRRAQDGTPPRRRDQDAILADDRTSGDSKAGSSRTLERANVESPQAGIAPTALAGGVVPHVSRHRLPQVATVAAIAAITLGAIVFAIEHGKRPADASTNVASADRSDARPNDTVFPPASHNSDALAHFNAGMQSWRDASREDATKSFLHATELDPSLAAAHLYLAMLPFWTDDSARTHHHAASMHRELLNVRDRMLLDAYEPAMAVPPDLDTSSNRLIATRNAFPADWLVLHLLAYTEMKRGDLESAKEIVGDLLRREPSLPIAWQDKGICFGLLNDITTAREALKECIRISPYGGSCFGVLTQLNLEDGECAEAEGRLRTLTARSPSEARTTVLAEAIQGRGGSPESVHEVLEQASQLAPENEREIVRQRNRALFSARYGKFDEAKGAIDAWGKAIANDRYEEEHARLAKLQFYLSMELGDQKRASQLASQYLVKRDAWIPSGYLDPEIVPLRVQYLTGGFTREVFQQRRADWLHRQSARRQVVDETNGRWIAAYALAAVTPEDAAEALDELPHYLPIMDALSRDLELDYGIGRVYLLAGDIDHALPYLRRAAGSCQGLRSPFERAWSNLTLGSALEKIGDKKGACMAYNVVLSQWGREPRSSSAKIAAVRRAGMHCSTP